jgi:tetratricopeptide (TPR) repeat protein
MKKLFIISSFVFSTFASADSVLSAIEANKLGITALKKQNSTEAQSYFSKAIGQAPFIPELQINLGLSYDMAGNQDKAVLAYQASEKILSSKDALYIVNFNLGEIAGRKKEIDLALSYYQKSLEFNPDSVEAKTNIELLIQQQQAGKDGKNEKDKKDNEDKKGDSKGKDSDKDKGKDQDKEKEKDKGKENEKENEQNKNYQKGKPQPRPFKSEELSPGDVKKILEEMDRQEKRVRAEFNKKQIKERTRDKDW